ncbi:MAG: hypothetical protein Q7S16_01470 [bacterium]|nr:hypothetical protein [bacterium]
MARGIATVLLFAVLLPALVGGGVFGGAREAGAAEPLNLSDFGGGAPPTAEQIAASTSAKADPVAAAQKAVATAQAAYNDDHSEANRVALEAARNKLVEAQTQASFAAEKAATPSPCGWTDVICGLKFLILQILLAIQGLVTTIFLWILKAVVTTIAQYNSFLTSPVVTIGWVLVRDIANLFFILILLVIAFSTILGVEKLSYKQHLMKLLIMAVVINFSKMITGLMIDFSQVVMLTFANAMTNTGAFSASMGVGKAGSFSAGTASADFFGIIINTVLGIVMMLFSAIVVGVIAIMLLARILVLWILTALSPLPFLLSAFPQGQQYAGKWWSELSKNLVGGPVLMFFLWLAFAIQANMTQALAGLVPAGGGIGSGAATTGDAIVTFAVTAGLLIAGLKFAQESGAAGASAAGTASKFMTESMLKKPLERFVAGGGLGKPMTGIGKLAERFGAKGLGAGLQKFGKGFGRATGMLTPEAIKRGLAGREKRLDRVFMKPGGAAEDFINKRANLRMGTTGGAKTLGKVMRWMGKGKKDGVLDKMGKRLSTVREAGTETTEERGAAAEAIQEIVKELEGKDLTAEQFSREAALAKSPEMIAACAVYSAKYKHENDEARVSAEMAEEGEIREEDAVSTSGTFDPVKYYTTKYNQLKKTMGEDEAKKVMSILTQQAEKNGSLRGAIGYSATDAKGNIHMANEWQGGEKEIQNADGTKTKLDLDTLKGQQEYVVHLRKTYKLTEEQMPDVTEETKLKKGQELKADGGLQEQMIAENMAANTKYKIFRGDKPQTWGQAFGKVEGRTEADDGKLGDVHSWGARLRAMLGKVHDSSERNRPQGRELEGLGIPADGDPKKVDYKGFVDQYALNPRNVMGKMPFAGIDTAEDYAEFKSGVDKQYETYIEGLRAAMNGAAKKKNPKAADVSKDQVLKEYDLKPKVQWDLVPGTFSLGGRGSGGGDKKPGAEKVGGSQGGTPPPDDGKGGSGTAGTSTSGGEGGKSGAGGEEESGGTKPSGGTSGSGGNSGPGGTVNVDITGAKELSDKFDKMIGSLGDFGGHFSTLLQGLRDMKGGLLASTTAENALLKPLKEANKKQEAVAETKTTLDNSAAGRKRKKPRGRKNK